MYVKVRAKTSARKESVMRVSVDYFEIAVREKPQNNLANMRIISILSLALRVPGKSIRFISGHHSPSKLFEIK